MSTSLAFIVLPYVLAGEIAEAINAFVIADILQDLSLYISDDEINSI